MRTYLTHPSIFGNMVSFVSQGDLFVMNLDTHEVRALVRNFGVVAENRFSPDGTSIYFRLLRGQDQIISEIYSIDLRNVSISRRTNFGSSMTLISGFTAEGHLVVSTNAFTFNRGYTELYGMDGNGNLYPMGFGPATDFFQSGSRVFIGRNTRELPHWKHYRGGTHGVIWSADTASGPFHMIQDNGFNISSPFLMGDRVFFSSDHEGYGCIYSMDLQGSDVVRVTDPGKFYHRNPSGHNGNIVFQCGADIYILRKNSKDPELLDVPLEIDQSKIAPRNLSPMDWGGIVTIDESGDSLAMVIRGTGKILNVQRGPVASIVRNEGRLKLVSWIGNGSILAVHTETGEDSISEYDTQGSSIKDYTGDWGIITEMVPSPDGRNIAFTNSRNELHLLGRGDSICRRIAVNTFGKISDLSWHPSGKFIAYTHHRSELSSQIRIYSISEDREYHITSYGYRDSSPVFDPSGHFMAYLSQRELDPVYDKVAFQLGYPIASRPYLVTLTSENASPFTVGYFPEDEKKESIDFEGIMGRSISFPMEIADYGKIAFGKDTLFSLKFPVHGSSKSYNDESDEREDGNLQAYDLRENRLKEVVDGIKDFSVSGNGERILLVNSEGIYVSKSTSVDLDLKSGSSDDLVEVDLTRVPVRVYPAVEFRGMFRESWVLMREHYWDPGKTGDFWSQVYQMYRPLLDRVGSRPDLSDLIRSMIGEMGSSHCYESLGDLTESQPGLPGRLGADFRVEGGLVCISAIYKGDPTNADEKSPLSAPGVNIKEGDRILEVDSRKISTIFELFDALTDTGEKTIQLKISGSGGERISSVTPLSDEKHLRYRNWVEKNRKYVHEKSGGMVGYIHIPDMGPTGYNEFFRLLYSETRYDSLIVDVRYNGGGHVSELLLEKLNRRRLGFDRSRTGDQIPYPSYSVNGKMVALTNEYAGSDGDIFSHSFKLMGLGKLIGTRTWGGVFGFESFIDLVDGTSLAQPQFAFSFTDVGMGVENYGTDPDIRVDISPDQYLRGLDPQLDAAIQEASSRQ